MKKIYLSLVVLCAFVMAYLPSIAQDAEPNDNAFAAKPLGLNMMINGTMFPMQADTVDWYRVEIANPGAVNIECIPIGMNMDVILQVYTSNDNGVTTQLLETSDVGIANQMEKISNPSVQPGLYYVVVILKQGQGMYSLKLDYTQEQPTNPVLSNLFIDDFEDEDLVSLQGNEWGVITDNSSGGNSSANIYLNEYGLNNSIGALRVQYFLDKASLPYDPFILARINLQANAQPVNVSAAQGIRLDIENPEIVKIQLVTANVTDYAYYEYVVNKNIIPSNLVVPFSSFTQPVWGSPAQLDLTQLVAIQIQTVNTDGTESYFVIDNIEIYANQTQPSGFVLDDFSDGDLINNLGGGWYKYEDSQMGGGSVLQYSLLPENTLQATYTLEQGSLNFDPFVLVGTMLNGQNTSVDITGSTGITFTYQGRDFFFDVIDDIGMAGENYQIHIPGATEPKTVTILWSQLNQPSWATNKYPLNLSIIKSFQWRIQAPSGTSGVINIDDVTILNYQTNQSQDSVDVTFSVNMKNQTVSPHGVRLNGSFINWETSQAIPMQYVGNDVYTTTVKLPVGAVIQYKFINGTGDDYAAYEVINQGCADPMYGNRVLTVSSTNKVLPLVCFASCTDCIESGGVNVTIMTNQNVGSAPLLVEFTGMSLSNIITWNWEFGDGYYGQGQTTMHQYNNPGVYTAILRVLDDKGVAGMTTATITVNSASYLSPYISVDRNSGFVPFVSNFSGNCTGNIVSWMWDFGDGTTGSGQYVSHSYTQEGIYIVTLNVLDDTGKTGSYYIYITATKPSNTLKTEFWAQNYANYAPFTVNFGDYSDGGPTEWYWDFQNDGIIDSYEQNPTYVYQNPGYYSVKLIIKNAQGYIDSLVKYNFIEVWQPIQIENYCEKAVPAQLGSNYFDFATANSSHFGQPMKWYSYTATSNKLLKIDLCNSGYNHWQEVFDIYINCEGTYANDIKRNFCNMSQNSVFPVQDGQTIYFSIVCEGGVNGEKGLTFELTEMPILPGSICSFAKTATVGTNNATTVAGDDWFEFVVPNDGYYEVSTCGKTTLDTDVEIYKSCNSYSWLSSSNDCGLQSKVMFHASQAETLKIVWRDFNSKGQFPWEIKYLGTQIVYPEFSVSNNMGVDSALVYFYNNSINAISYAWDFNNDGVIDSNLENPVFVYMQPGIYTVKLQITGYEGVQLVTKTIVKPDYILVQKSSQTGTYCQLAKQAVIGNNTMSMVDGTTQWFKYTSDFEGKLVIQTCNSNYPLGIYIYDTYDDCNNHRVYGSNTMCGNKTTQYIDVVPGKTYYFNMMIYTYVSGINTVNYELIKQLPQPGDLCGLPIILQSSSIQSIQKPVGNIGSANVEKWYSFTAPYNGVAEINTCINQDLGMINAELFNTCNMNDYNNYPDYDYRECLNSNYGYSSGVKVVQMVKDQTILIKVSGSVSQVAQWQFLFRDYYTGEVCTKPLLAKQGVNSNPSGLTEIFYTYTAQDNGVVNVSNCQYVTSSAQFSGVQVRTSCDKETGEIVQYGAANCNGSYGADIAFQVEKGKTYIIQWFTHVQNWNLDFIKDAVLPPGYTCQNPIVISQEQTVVQPTGNITWLELSYPQSGTVSLSSNLNIEANVFLFDECTPLSENLKSTVPYVMMDSAIVFWPQANKKYKMLIVFSEQAPTMPYTIQSKYLSNQSQPANVVCADAKPLSLGAQQTTTVYGNYWYSYNAKANTIVHLDFNNEQFQQLQIWPSIYFSCPSPFDSHGGGYYNNVFMPCGNNLQGITMPIEKDTTLYIQFRSRNLSTTVNWTLNEYSTKSVAITSFSSMQQISNAVINSITRTINLTVAQSASIFETPIDFKVSPGATIKTSDGITLCPGSQLFFNNGITTITVTSADGTVSQNWTVNIVKSTVVSNKAEIVGLYSSVLKDVQINSVTNTVTATVPYFIQDCYQLNIQVSAGAMIMNPLQTQCFDGSNPMTRTVQVKAEDGTTIKTWTINFVREVKPVGADCDKLATAVKGYNTIPFAQYQDTYFMEYTMENNGTFEVDACTSNMMLGAYIILDCETIDNSAILTYCKDPNFASKSQKEYTKGQKVKIAVFRV